MTDGRSKYGWNERYMYVHNNPLNYLDPTGNVAETVINVLSIGWSTYEMWSNPSWVNAGFLTWDIAAAFTPFLPGSYTARGVGLVVNGSDTIKALKQLNRADRANAHTLGFDAELLDYIDHVDDSNVLEKIAPLYKDTL